jgi:hypothetical protein
MCSMTHRHPPIATEQAALHIAQKRFDVGGTSTALKRHNFERQGRHAGTIPSSTAARPSARTCCVAMPRRPASLIDPRLARNLR